MDSFYVLKLISFENTKTKKKKDKKSAYSMLLLSGLQNLFVVQLRIVHLSTYGNAMF